MFKKLIVMLAMCLLASTAWAKDYAQAKAEFQQTHPPRDYLSASGADIAGYLNIDALHPEPDCNGFPAYLCSGVMIRAALPGAGFHIWDPSPSGETTGAMSFSYLRTDARINKFVHDETSGYIIYPDFWLADGLYKKLDVLCSFPLDADTINRSDRGCGRHINGGAKSDVCQKHGVMLAQQWYDNGISMTGQCGFETDEQSPYNSASAFLQSTQARNFLMQTPGGGAEQNEIRIATWPKGLTDSLPIEAFWYLAGDITGLRNARTTQEDFYNTSTTHRIIPIISVSLPVPPAGVYKFIWQPADQAVTK